jgi:PAS domain S-box-containing protein
MHAFERGDYSMEQHEIRAKAPKRNKAAATQQPHDRADYLEAALGFISDAVITTDLAHIITGCNRAAGVYYGFDDEAAEGKRVYELLDLRIYGLFFTLPLPQIMEQGFIEHTFVHAPAGKPSIRLYGRVTPVCGDAGQAFGYAFVSREIPRHAKPSDALHLYGHTSMPGLTDSDYLEIVNSSTEASWVLDIPSGIVRYSRKWASRIGIDETGTIDHMAALRLAVHPEDQRYVFDSMNAVIQSKGAEYHVPFRALTKDKGYVWVLSKGTVFYDSDRNPIRIVGMILDISEMKNLEQQLQDQAETLRHTVEDLRKKEQEYLSLTNSEGIGLFVDDLLSGSIQFSPNWVTRFGIPSQPGDSQHKHVYMDSPPDHFLRYRECMTGCIGRAESNFTVDQQIQLHGKAIHTMIYGRIFYNDAGTAVKVMGLLVDMTGYKEIERQLREKAEELGQKNKLITNFFTNISHEFRTPLSVILMAGDMLGSYMHASGAKICLTQLKYTGILRQNALRLQRLIENLLEITNIEAGFVAAHPSRVDIVQLLGDLAGLVSELSGPMGIEVSFDAACAMGPVAMDEGKLVRILLNLLSNAVKFSREGGHVRIRLEAAQDALRFSVCDSGEGIPKDTQAFLFDKFTRVHSSLTRTNEGCGMGLALTKALVALLGGRIWFESEPGRGSEFFVELPVKSGAAAEPMPLVESIPLARRVEMEFSDIAWMRLNQ